MTTILGVKHPEVDLSLLVGDRQSTRIDPRTGFPNGNKDLSRKLWKSEGDNYCFGHAGSVDKQTSEFVENFISEKYDIEEIIEKGYFPDLRDLNINKMGTKIPDMNNLSSLLIATRINNSPRLYTCFPLGAVEERTWTSIGSGSERAMEYFKALNILGDAQDYQTQERKTNKESIIRIGLEAGRRAQKQDLYSHGLDMMICTPDMINDHYNDLGDGFEEKLKNIQEKYKNSEE